jgi:YmaF family
MGRQQRHTHEFLGSTRFAEQGQDRHNHRFAGVTSEAIPIPGGNHIHTITVNTDFGDHHHRLVIKTGPAIPVGNGKHVHLVRGVTTVNDGHVHRFVFTTLIDRPTVS